MTGPFEPAVEPDAPSDRRTARLLARAQAGTLAADAAVERRARERELALHAEQQRAEFNRKRRDAERADAERVEAARRVREAEDVARRLEHAERRWEVQARRRAARLARRSALLTRLRDAAPAVGMGTLVVIPIGMAMSVAWIGQIGFARHVLAWPLFGALLFAGGLEASTLLALGLYIRARRAGDPGTAPRLVALGLAANAAAMNYWHASPHRAAVAFAAMSLVGPGLTELVASQRHRAALREAGRLPARRPRFGLAHWLRFPVRTFTAWSLALRHGVTTTAEALAAADRELARRDSARRTRRTRRGVRPVPGVSELDAATGSGADCPTGPALVPGSGQGDGSGDDGEPPGVIPGAGSGSGSREPVRRDRAGLRNRQRSRDRSGPRGEPGDLVGRAVELLRTDPAVSARRARQALGVRHAAAQGALDEARQRLTETEHVDVDSVDLPTGTTGGAQ